MSTYLAFPPTLCPQDRFTVTAEQKTSMGSRSPADNLFLSPTFIGRFDSYSFLLLLTDRIFEKNSSVAYIRVSVSFFACWQKAVLLSLFVCVVCSLCVCVAVCCALCCVVFLTVVCFFLLLRAAGAAPQSNHIVQQYLICRPNQCTNLIPSQWKAKIPRLLPQLRLASPHGRKKPNGAFGAMKVWGENQYI